MNGDGWSRAAVEEFLFEEAELLNSGRWTEWFALFTDDAWYWVPARADQPDPINEVSLIYDDIANLEVRVNRMRHPAHHANKPALQCAHHVGNVRVAAARGDECHVVSRLVMFDRRGDTVRSFSARVEHGLRRVGGTIRIASKKVALLDADAPQEELVIPF